MNNAGINNKNYEFIQAVDGYQLKPSEYYHTLFKNNDFGYRLGVMGCALSHYNLWTQLLDDHEHDYYMIMEDDFTLGDHFLNKLVALEPYFKAQEFIFLSYSMFAAHRNEYKSLYYENNMNNIKMTGLNRNIYIGGFFSYTINKAGAQKMVDYIKLNGIKHGIDYLIKINHNLNAVELQPFITFSNWDETGAGTVDSNIQQKYETMNFDKLTDNIDDDLDIDDVIFEDEADDAELILLKSKFTLYPQLDIIQEQKHHNHSHNLRSLLQKALDNDNCMAVNTLGVFKSYDTAQSLNFAPSKHYMCTDGIYVKNEALSYVNLMTSKNITNSNICFIHSCTLKTHGTKVLEEYISLILSSKLIDQLHALYIINIGEIIDTNLFMNKKIIIINLSRYVLSYEIKTINAIHNFSKRNPNNNILYIHTKGITHVNEIVANVESWARMMLYFLVTKHENCIKLLGEYDVAGCNYSLMPCRHYSGNFWWATTNYISTLNIIGLTEPRHACEFWLLKPAFVKQKTLHNSNVNNYFVNYTPDFYVNTDIMSGIYGMHYYSENLPAIYINKNLSLLNSIKLCLLNDEYDFVTSTGEFKKLTPDIKLNYKEYNYLYIKLKVLLGYEGECTLINVRDKTGVYCFCDDDDNNIDLYDTVYIFSNNNDNIDTDKIKYIPLTNIVHKYNLIRTFSENNPRSKVVIIIHKANISDDIIRKCLNQINKIICHPNFYIANCSYLLTLRYLINDDVHSWISNNNNNTIIKKYHNHNHIKIKMMCNWCSSKDLCKEWSNMYNTDNSWNNNITMTDSDDADYFVIINKPCISNTYYDPKKTIIFQMEPWVNNPSHNWGVKTWNAWATPDPSKFLAVRGRKTEYHNNAFWQLEQTCTQLTNDPIIKTKLISSICSSKYFDEGHIARIDLLKYIESKNDSIIIIDIYNFDNHHQFKNYRGPVTPYIDKSKGMMSYKYYFMIENNYERNFITEKIWEPILCESLVFYYGCPNVSDYINPLAYVQLDINDYEKSFQIIKQAIAEDWHSQRLNIIKAEKKKILEKLAFFPVISEIITEYIHNHKQ